MESSKKTKVSKPRAPPTHPGFKDMIIESIKFINEKKGSSRQAIRKYIEANYDVKQHGFNSHLNVGLRKLIDSGFLIHPKTAPGSYKINKVELDKVEKEAKAKAKAVLKKEQEKKKMDEEKAKNLAKKKKQSPTAATKKKKTIKKTAPKKEIKKSTKVTKTTKKVTKTAKKSGVKKPVAKTANKKTPKKPAAKKVSKKPTGPKKTTKK